MGLATRRLDILEDKLAAGEPEQAPEHSLVERLREARLNPAPWPFTQSELDELTLCPPEGTHPKILRIARGLHRAGLVRAPIVRAMPQHDPEELLISICGALTHRPFEFALVMFPWGESGNELAKNPGPRDWQRDVLIEISDALKANNLVGAWDAIRRAISSGHAAGKSALVGMIVVWALSTFENSRANLLANSSAQLAGKTMPEVSRWHRLSLTAHWFEYTALSLAHSRTWRADGVAWSEDRIEGVQGAHMAGGRLLTLTDECSAHPPRLWEALSGALVDQHAEIIWLATGNCLRATGPFYDALMAEDSPWHPRFIDTRTIPELNQPMIAQLVVEYGGEESNLTRTRVRGLPPTAGDMAFFDRAAVVAAMQRPEVDEYWWPVVIGVDVGSRGSDPSVIAFRQGLNGMSRPPIKIRGIDPTALAARVAKEANALRMLGLRVVIMVDGTGVGAGCVSRVRELGYDCVDVQFAARAPDPRMYANLRAHMHGELRDWITRGGSLPDDKMLLEETAAIDYAHDTRGAIILEPKPDIRAKLGRSPDTLDAYCITFGAPIMLDVRGDEDTDAELCRRKKAYELDVLAHAIAESRLPSR